MRISKLAIVFLSLIMSSCASTTPEQRFWSWFQDNEATLFKVSDSGDGVLESLADQLNAVHPDLVYEIAPVRDDGTREFVISAAGMKSAFPAVEALYVQAPELGRWVWTKFRPRRTPINNVTYGGMHVEAENVHYALYGSHDKPGIILFLDGYDESEHTTFATIGYLMLDEALGEFDVETKVGFIEFHNRESDQFQYSGELSGLAEHFDELLQRRLEKAQDDT